MNITCRKIKNYALTKGKSYAVVKTTNNRYTIINDKGIEKRYGSNLFSVNKETIMEEVLEDPIGPEVEIKPVKVKKVISKFTFEELLNSIVISASINENNDKIVDILIKYKKTKTLFSEPVYLHLLDQGNSFSCGIRLLTGINNLLNYLLTQESTRNFLTENNKAILFDAILNKVKEYVYENRICGVLLVSTNTRVFEEGISESRSTLLEPLDNISDSSFETYNPNSGNMIKIWNIDIELEPEEEEEEE